MENVNRDKNNKAEALYALLSKKEKERVNQMIADLTKTRCNQ